jgi:hypothetical protein
MAGEEESFGLDEYEEWREEDERLTAYEFAEQVLPLLCCPCCCPCIRFSCCFLLCLPLYPPLASSSSSFLSPPPPSLPFPPHYPYQGILEEDFRTETLLEAGTRRVSIDLSVHLMKHLRRERRTAGRSTVAVKVGGSINRLYCLQWQ